MKQELTRAIQPQTRVFEKFHMTPPEKVTAPCGVPMYVIPGEKQEVVRIDLLFNSGAYNQTAPLQASSAAVLASEATRRYSSARMSELVDYYGGWLQRAVYMHASLYTLYVPKRNYLKLLPLLIEIFSAPRFSRRDLALYKERGKAEYRQLNERVDFLAAKSLRRQLYTSHPYGATATADDFGHITIPLLKEYHERHCTQKNCTALLSGCIDDNTVARTAAALALLPERDAESAEKALFPEEDGIRFTHDPKDEALQCSVRIGSRMNEADAAEYPLIGLVNTMLGGYFGSRLMKNIREEKGYTYSIGSSITTLRYATSITIAAQCDLKYAASLIKEVFAEINRLKETPAGAEEIKSVKQYILGEMNRIFDNRFTFADACLSMLINGRPLDYLNRKAEAINSATAAQIIETAQKYLHPGQMHTAVAGGSSQYGKNLEQMLKI